MDDRSGEIIAVNILFMVLTTVIVALRGYCRGWIIRSFGLDDYIMFVTWVIFLLYLVCQLLTVQHGTGKHRSELDPSSISKALMWWYACQLTYILCTCLLKISVGFFLLRVAVDLKHIWVLRISMAVTLLFSIAYFFVMAFKCSPVSTFWEIDPKARGKCLPEGPIVTLTYVALSLNCVADWIFGILPGFIVWSLRMPLKTKILVVIILSFAAIGSTATIVRATYISTIMNSDDFLYATAGIAIWSTVEPGIGISAASVATLRPLMQLLSYKIGLSSSGPSNPEWRERHRDPGMRMGYLRSNSLPRGHVRRPKQDDTIVIITSSETDLWPVREPPCKSLEAV